MYSTKGRLTNCAEFWFCIQTSPHYLSCSVRRKRIQDKQLPAVFSVDLYLYLYLYLYLDLYLAVVVP